MSDGKAVRGKFVVMDEERGVVRLTFTFRSGVEPPTVDSFVLADSAEAHAARVSAVIVKLDLGRRGCVCADCTEVREAAAVNLLAALGLSEPPQ